MAEREGIIVAIDALEVRLRPAAAVCAGCSIGCGGKCNVFQSDTSGDITLARRDDSRLQVGDRVRVHIDELALRRAAFAGYGIALLGLVLGAAAGYATALWLDISRDPATLLGLIGGTVLALRYSKHHRIDPMIEPLESRGKQPH